MKAFEEKAIFLWCYWDITEDTKALASALAGAGFEAVYVHCNDGIYEASYPRLENGKYVSHLNCTDQLVSDLRAAGLKVYGWGAPYGSIAGEIKIMKEQSIRYKLEGYVIDAESTWDARANVIQNTRDIITGLKRVLREAEYSADFPVMWCWWPLWKAPISGALYHDSAILAEAMKFADYGQPMSYWSWGDDAAAVIRYLTESIAQWRAISNKPLIPAGRAYKDQYGDPTGTAIKTFDQRARELGALGLSFWDAQHAIKLPYTWDALSLILKFQEENNTMTWKTHALGLYCKDTSRSFTGFQFIAGWIGKSWIAPDKVKIQAIETAAKKEILPLIAVYDFNVDFYTTRMQYPMDKALWPPLAKDEPLQRFIDGISYLSKDLAGVVIRINDQNDHDGKKQSPEWISFAAEIFAGRALDWLKIQRPQAAEHFFIATSNSFINAFAPNLNNWIHKYNSWNLQPAKLPLDSSYPQDSDKPGYFSTRNTCEMWQYYSASAFDLVLYNVSGVDGSAAALYQWLGFVPGGADTTPPTSPGAVSAAVSGKSVNITWSASVDEAGGAVSYRIYKNGSATPVLTTTSRSALFTDLAPGSYQFGVSAFDTAGNESAIAFVSAVIPGDPPAVDLSAVLALLEELKAANAVDRQLLEELKAASARDRKLLEEMRAHFA